MARSKENKARASGDAHRSVVETDVAPIIMATIDYEQWLKKRIDVVVPDLQLKHETMAGSLFAFLRATFYRWVSLWQEVCPDLTETPRVLTVGDLHVENFGTWRDTEGRLVWGVDDFDEVARMPYAVDLLRLVPSRIGSSFDPHDWRPEANTVCLGGRAQFCFGRLPIDAPNLRGSKRLNVSQYLQGLSTGPGPIRRFVQVPRLLS
jgi:Uncharacterized protein conserved in bacteria (DUF2252)